MIIASKKIFVQFQGPMFSERRVEYVVRTGCAGLVIYLVALCSGYSQTASAKSDTLSTAKLPEAVKKQVYQQIAKDLAPLSDEDRAATYNFRLSRLGPDGSWGIQVWGAGQVCGMRNCPFWLFDRKTGESLLSDSAAFVSLAHRTHHGRYDIEVIQMLSGRDAQRDLYQFDGRSYQRVRSTVDRNPDQN